MSDFLKHECGIAMIRQLKPLAYSQEKYGTPLASACYFYLWRNSITEDRTVPVLVVKLGVSPGRSYMARERSIEVNPLAQIFRKRLDELKMVDSGTIHPGCGYS